MNEGNSAGGGHEGLSPAPPAVPDRVTPHSTEISVATAKTTTTTGAGSAGAALPATRHHHHIATQAKGIASSSSSSKQKQLASAQLPVPLSPLPQQQQQTTEATAAAAVAPPAHSNLSAASSIISTIEASASPPQAKRQRLDNNEDRTSATSIVGTAGSSNIVGSLLPASVASSTEVGGLSTTALQDLNALKKRILQQKLQILRNLKERWVSFLITPLLTEITRFLSHPKAS